MRDLVLVNMTGSSLLIRLGTCSSRTTVIAVIGGSVVHCERSQDPDSEVQYTVCYGIAFLLPEGT
jgi:hypothetical protein